MSSSNECARRSWGVVWWTLGVLGCLFPAVGCDSREDTASLASKTQNAGTSPATWPSEGPTPITSGIPYVIAMPSGQNHMTGATERFLFDPANPNGAYVASVNGGLFKTDDYTTILSGAPTAPISWIPTTDQLPSLGLGALAIDPTDPQHILAGTGCVSSGGLCGTEGLLYLSTTGGVGSNPWSIIDDPLLLGKKIQGVAVRGTTILVATGFPGSPGGVSGGIFRRTTGTGLFQSRVGMGGLPALLGAVFDLVADPLDASGYYAVVGGAGGGVYRTPDLGATWVRVSDNDTAPSGLSYVLGLPVTNARLATALTGELFVTIALHGQVQYVAHTSDQGATWASMDTPKAATGSGSSVGGITRVAGSPQIVVDCGIADCRASNRLPPGQHVRLSGVPVVGGEDLNGDWRVGDYIPPGASAPSTTEVTLLDRFTLAEGTGSTTALSIPGGGTWLGWVSPNNLGQGGIHLAIAVDPATPGLVYLAGDAGPAYLMRGDASIAGGGVPSAQWTSLVGPSNTVNGTHIHSDIRDLTFDAAGNLVASTDGGPFLRTSPSTSGGDWYSLSGDMVTGEMYTIAVDPLSRVLLGGFQDNGVPEAVGPMTGLPNHWNQILGADGLGVAAVDSGLGVSYRYAVAQYPDSYTRWHHDSTGALAPGSPPAGFQLQLAVAPVPPPPATPTLLRDVDDIAWNQALAINPFAPDRVLIGGRVQGIWESLDRGDTVSLVAGSPLAFTGIAAGASSNPEAMWAVGPAGVFQRFAAGGMTQVTFPAPQPFAVAMAPSNPQVAVVTTMQGQVFLTLDGGGNWDPVTGDLQFAEDAAQVRPTFLRDVLYVESATTGDRVFVASASGVLGVYMMAVDNPGAWMRIGTNLPRAPAMALDYHLATDTIVVGTFGRGAWSVSGATQLNRAPEAQCTTTPLPPVAANAQCLAIPDAAAFSTGATDPEGDSILPSDFVEVINGALVPVPPGGLGLGPHDLRLRVTDSHGSADLCGGLFIVEDQTPPVLMLPADVHVTSCLSTETVVVGEASATDNCAQNLVPTGQVVSKNGVALSPPIPVVNGEVELGPGSYIVEWMVDDGSTATTPVTKNQTVTVSGGIVATNVYQVRDRASVEDVLGNPAAVLNSGSGITSIGGDGATVGAIVAGGNVNVAWNGYVYGDITAVGTVQVNDPSKHFGSVVPASSVQLPAPPVLPTFSPPAGGDQWINPGTTLSLPPGSYGQVGVNGNPNPNNAAVLRLSPGDYFFTNLYFNSAGLVVVAEPGTRIFASGNVTFNTSIVTAVGSNELAPVVLGVAGSGSLALYAPFTGTVIAPQRDLVVGTANGMTFRGSFFARSIDVTPNSVLVCDPMVAAQEPPTCSNGDLDAGETDVDCGGSQCDACADGDVCAQGSDCVSQVCTATICQVPTCSDQKHNGLETGTDCGGPSCPACPVTCNSYTYQAESMYHSTGNAWWQGGWNIYSNGYIAATHNFSAGSNVITVSAFGEQALGVLPHMRVTVGGVAVNPTAGVNVTTNGFNPYQFTFNATGGSQEIRVIFDNDASGWFGDRNLIVRTVAVSCP